ncbi:retrovirus-related pol polyprotein from transposon TNT 1-94 [Tanacetum coccineum]
MGELRFITFKGDNLRGMSAVVQGLMLRGVTEMWAQIQQVRQRLFAAITARVKALESRAVLDEEQMAFLADNRDTVTIVATGHGSQELTISSIFQTNDLDAFDSNCDEAPSASVVLMAKFSAYDSDILSEVPSHDINLDNNVFDNNVQELWYSEQPPFIDDLNIESTSDSNVISYEQYLKESKNEVVQGTTSLAQQDALIMSVIEELSNKVAQCNALNKENKIVNESLRAELERYKEQVKIFEERQKFDLNDRENYIDSKMRDVIVKRNAKFVDFEKEIQSLKLHLSAHMSDNKLLTTTVDVLKKETKEKEDKYLDEIIALEKKKKELDNIVYKMAKRKQPALYYGQTIVKKHDALFVPDSEETLELADTSRIALHKGLGTQWNTLRDIVEQAKALKPLDNTLEYDCKFTTRIQELCTKSWSAKRNKKQEWKPTGHVFTYVGHRWIPTGRAFTIDENKCPLTRFGNDHVTTIMGYGDYQIGNVMISWVYYVEGLGHNLFSVGQFCDSDLEVAFHKHTCFVRDLKGVDLLKGSRGTNLYTLSLEEMMQSSPTCLLSKASKTKSWLWHRRLSHLNFGTINELSKKGLVRGLPKLKYQKDHLCSACSLGKSKKHTHKPKSKDFIQENLYLLHMDLCGPMRVESINEKKYILVIVDDYS